MLLGYHQYPGGRWSGDFIVAELPQPSGGGDVPERPRIFRTADVHTVKGKPWSFPLSEKKTSATKPSWTGRLRKLRIMTATLTRGASSRILMMVAIPTIRSKSRSVRVSRMRQASRLPQPRRMPRPTTPFLAVTPKGTSKSGSGTTRRQRRRYAPHSNGPPWSAVFRRVTKDASTHEVIADEKVSGDEPDYHDRWYSPVPDGPRDIITELHDVEPPGTTVPVKHLLSVKNNVLYEAGPAGMSRRPADTERPVGITPADWRSMAPSTRDEISNAAQRQPDICAAAVHRGGNARGRARAVTLSNYVAVKTAD